MTALSLGLKNFGRHYGRFPTATFRDPLVVVVVVAVISTSTSVSVARETKISIAPHSPLPPSDVVCDTRDMLNPLATFGPENRIDVCARGPPAADSPAARADIAARELSETIRELEYTVREEIGRGDASAALTGRASPTQPEPKRCRRGETGQGGDRTYLC